MSKCKRWVDHSRLKMVVKRKLLSNPREKCGIRSIAQRFSIQVKTKQLAVRKRGTDASAKGIGGSIYIGSACQSLKLSIKRKERGLADLSIDRKGCGTVLVICSNDILPDS